MKFSEKFSCAQDLHEEGRYREAVSLLHEMVSSITESKSKNLYLLLAHLGTNYLDLKEEYTALLYFEKSLQLRGDFEFSSMGKYIALHRLGRDEEAMDEMFTFLQENRADLYRTTIEELLEGLENGYSTKWEKEVRTLADNNGVQIHPGPSC